MSPCHRLPPRGKLLLAFVVILLAVSVPIRYWPVQGIVACVIFSGHALAGIPLGYSVRRLAVFVPLLLLMALSVPLSQGFQAGWDIMAAVLLRGVLAFCAALWTINVMPFDQLLVALRRLHVSEVFIAILAFMYRYFFVLWDELDQMTRARRGRPLGRLSPIVRWKTSAYLVGMLLVRAMGRAERVHGAMCARGWDGHVRTLDA